MKLSRLRPLQLAHALAERARLRRYRRQGLSVGENFVCYGLPYISDPHLVTIGNNVSVSNNVVFIAHDGTTPNMEGLGLGAPFDTRAPIVVHDDCAIGYGAIILPGVSIGPRSVVGAGSVVRTNVPPDTVVLGNPARVATTPSELARRRGFDRPEPSAQLRMLLTRRWPGRFSLADLTDETTVAEGLELDSVEVVELVLTCEEWFQITLPDDLLARPSLTLGDLARVIGERTGAARSRDHAA